MFDLSGFQRDLLFVVHGLDEPNGLEIKEIMQDDYQKDINHGRLYPNLDNLDAMGLIDKTEKDKRTNCYSITPRGRSEIVRRRKWEEERANLGDASTEQSSEEPSRIEA